MNASIWQPEMKDALRALYADGHSASTIAYEINSRYGMAFTRNAVIGVIHRLGLQPPKRRRPPKQRAYVAPFRSRQRPKPRTVEEKPPRLVASEATDIPAEPSPRAVTFAQLTADTCRWPIGDPKTPDFRFCGANHIDGSPYCLAHHRMAYQVGSRAA